MAIRADNVAFGYLLDYHLATASDDPRDGEPLPGRIAVIELHYKRGESDAAVGARNVA